MSYQGYEFINRTINAGHWRHSLRTYVTRLSDGETRFTSYSRLEYPAEIGVTTQATQLADDMIAGFSSLTKDTGYN